MYDKCVIFFAVQLHRGQDVPRLYSKSPPSTTAHVAIGMIQLHSQEVLALHFSVDGQLSSRDIRSTYLFELVFFLSCYLSLHIAIASIS